MASSIERKLAKHLECAICLEKFEEPKVLSCQHSYCRKCLERLMTRLGEDYMITCPECRKQTKVRGDTGDLGILTKCEPASLMRVIPVRINNTLVSLSGS